jgi:hypothetical protein
MLSVIIPARNEKYLQRTIQDVLDNATGEIEVIAVLDGYWPEPPIQDDKRVILIHRTEAIGQRQAINEAARIAKGEYIMKLDAHCAVDKGFDVKLAADCEYDWTVIPRMYNLDSETWKPKRHKRTDYMYIGLRENGELRAEYFEKGLRQPDNDKKIDDVMCCMGPCFFMHKDRFWELGGMDEAHGGWGQMGIEVACKAWLSGGSLKVNKNTWFSHWFRGGGGPGFPYQISGREVDKARKYSKDLWLNDKWPLQTRKFGWLVEKFNPPKFETKKTIIYLTDNTLDPVIAAKCREKLIEAAGDNPIISVSQEPVDLGRNICVGKIGRSWMSLQRQLLAGLEAATTKYVAIAEHDCLYTKEHFNWIPPRDDVFYYNHNFWLLWFSNNHPELKGMYSYWPKRFCLSQLICNRDLLKASTNERIALLQDGYHIVKGLFGAGEPGVCDRIAMGKLENSPERPTQLQEYTKGCLTEYESKSFMTETPNVDIRHNSNFTGPKRGKNRTYSIPYWGKFDEFWGAIAI